MTTSTTTTDGHESASGSAALLRREHQATPTEELDGAERTVDHLQATVGNHALSAIAGVQRSPDDGGGAEGEAPPEMTEEEAQEELERIKQEAASAPEPEVPKEVEPAEPAGEEEVPAEESKEGEDGGEGEAPETNPDESTGADVPEPGTESGLPGVAELESGGRLTNYKDEKAWHDEWVSMGSPVGMDSDDSWILIGQAVGAGGVEGLTGAAAAIAVDQALNVATRNIPYAAGFIALGEIALKGPDVWAEQQFAATGGRMIEGFGKLGSDDWLDKFEGVVDILDGLASLIGLISTICFIIAAAGFVISLFFPAVFPFVALAAKWGLFLGKIGTIAGLIVTALRLVLVAARVIQIRYFSANPEEQARRAERLRATTQSFTQAYATRRGNRYLANRSRGAPQQREGDARRPAPDSPDGAPSGARGTAGDSAGGQRARMARVLDAMSGGDAAGEFRGARESWADLQSMRGAMAEGGRARMEAVSEELPEGPVRERYREHEEPGVVRDEANARYAAAQESLATSQQDLDDARAGVQSARERERAAAETLDQSRQEVEGVAPDPDSALAQHRARAREADQVAREGDATARAYQDSLPDYDRSIEDANASWEAAADADDIPGMLGALRSEHEMSQARERAAETAREGRERADTARVEAEAARRAAIAEEATIAAQAGLPHPGAAAAAQAEADLDRAVSEGTYDRADEEHTAAMLRLGEAGEESSRAAEAASRRDEAEAGLGFARQGVSSGRAAAGQTARDVFSSTERPEEQGFGHQTTGGAVGAGTSAVMATDMWQNAQRQVAGAGSDWANEQLGLIDPTGSLQPQNQSPEAREDAERNRQRRQQWLEQQYANIEEAHRSMVEGLPPPPVEQETLAAEAAEKYAELDLEIRRLRFQLGEIDEMQVDAAGELAALETTATVMDENQQAISEEQAVLVERRRAQDQVAEQVNVQEAEAGGARGEQEAESSALADFIGGFLELMGMVPTDVVGNAGEGAGAVRQVGEGFESSDETTSDTLAGAEEGKATVEGFQAETEAAQEMNTETAGAVSGLQATVAEDVAETTSGIEQLGEAATDAQSRIQEIMALKEEEQQRYDEAIAAMESWAAEHHSLRTAGESLFEAELTEAETRLDQPEAAE